VKIFKTYGNDLSYQEMIQLDGAFSKVHINYGKSPKFNGKDAPKMAISSIENNISNKDNIFNATDNIYSFNGTERNLKKEDRIMLWKSYWLEYINAFSKLTSILPESIVTVYVGREAIEIGLKYLLLKKNGIVRKIHDLGKLSELLFLEYKISDSYMLYIDEFCSIFSNYIEGKNVEYFRYPEFKGGSYFAGNKLDIRWISYNFALITLKLIHFAGLDIEFIENTKILSEIGSDKNG